MNKFMRRTEFAQVKAVDGADGKATINGIASTYKNTDRMGDIFSAGAFDKWIKENKGKPLPMLWQHCHDKPIGTWDSITSDSKGLYVSGSINTQISWAKDAYEATKSGLVTGLSIGFDPKKHSRLKDGGFEFQESGLFEVSLVTVPANPKAEITDVKELDTVRRIEKYLIELGFSKSEAKAMASTWRDYRDDSGNERDALSQPDLSVIGKALDNLGKHL